MGTTKCNVPQSKSIFSLRCELDEGHTGPHRSSTVVAGEDVEWPNEAQIMAEQMSDLVKKYSGNR